MSEVKQEYTGIDPAPEPVSVSEAKVVEKAKKTANVRLDPRWAIALGFGTFAALSVKDLPMVRMFQMMAMSKLSVLSMPVAKILVGLGTVAIPTLGIYIALTIFPKLLDSVQCVMGGICHSARYTLVGLGEVFKNIGPIAKTCVQIPAAIVSPAYGSYLNSVEKKTTFEHAVRNFDQQAQGPFHRFLGYVLNGLAVIVLGLWSLIYIISSKAFPESLFAIAAIQISWTALNALYIIGRCARERKEKANGTTV